MVGTAGIAAIPLTKKAAILQSSYIPWKGYFDLINRVDEFILYDDVQYTRRDWRNRNVIKTPRGLQWLTIPVAVKGKFRQKIRETKISDPDWRRHHWAAIAHNYSKAPYFREYRTVFEPLYLQCQEQFLSRINLRFIEAICHVLGIKTKISWSMDYKLSDGRVQRLADLCRAVGATHYISGPAAKAYMDPKPFDDAKVAVSFIDYSGYPSYSQLYGPFNHKVSILDLIFNEGPLATKFMLSF